MPKLLLRGSTLLLLALVEYGVPLLRSVVLSRSVTLQELGFASLLAAVYGAFELLTDFSLHRFVLSTPRKQYEEALASAHALAIMRGLFVGALIVAVSPLIAAGFSLFEHWLEFALLGGIVALRSFEHLGPKVAERDYSYGPQFKMAALANLSGLGILVLTVILTRPLGNACFHVHAGSRSDAYQSFICGQWCSIQGTISLGIALEGNQIRHSAYA